MKDRPRRLGLIYFRSPLFFVTFCTRNHAKIPSLGLAQQAIENYGRLGLINFGVAIGRYVIMPDHVHVFVRGSLDFSLRQWVRILKRVLSKPISCAPPHWQKGFFDHLIRHSESYAAKWEYVRQNPVRAGLVQRADEWPWQGEIVRLQARSV